MRWATALVFVFVAVACGGRADPQASSSKASGGPVAAAPGPPPTPSATASSAAVVALAGSAIAVDPDGVDRVKRDIEYLASRELAGRDTGSEGARLASEYIAKRFTDLGLAPFGDSGDPDDPATTNATVRDYFFRYSPFANAKVNPPVLEILTDETGSDAGPKAPLVIPPAVLRTADGAASGEVSADVVFAGFGVSTPEWDDYESADVEGKVVVVMRGSPQIPLLSKEELYELATFRSKIHAAVRHKAAGLVVVSPTDALPPLPLDPKSAGLPAIVIARSASRGLFPSVGLDEGTAWSITKPMRAKPVAGRRVHMKTSVASLGKYSRDVVGWIPALEGAPTRDEYVVLGAHYDHIGMGGDARSMAPGIHAIHPGADDNASGTALVMEVARRISQLPRHPERNVVFLAFSGEELGLLGSHAWVDDPPIPMSDVIAMVNADMVGRLRKNELTIQGTKGIAAWNKIFHQADDGLGLDLLMGDSGEDFSDRSDQASFRAVHVPAAFLFTGLHPDYHRPSDTADKINAEGLETIATLATRAVVQLAEGGLRDPATAAAKPTN